MIRMYFGRILDHYACIDYGEKITVICHLSVQKLRLITEGIFEPRHEKTCLQGFQPGETQATDTS